MSLPQCPTGAGCIQKSKLIAQHKATIDAALPLSSEVNAIFGWDNAKIRAALGFARKLVERAHCEIDAHRTQHGC